LVIVFSWIFLSCISSFSPLILSSLSYRCVLCVYQALAPANAFAMSDIVIDQLSPDSAKAKLKECSTKFQETQGLISPVGDSASMISRLSRCVNELECLRLDLYNSFVDHLDLIPIKVSDQPEL